jgi:uncharacterized protein involved in exopolysaccharide biosynthesis
MRYGISNIGLSANEGKICMNRYGVDDESSLDKINDGVDIFELLGIIWQGKFSVILWTISLILIFTAYAVITPNVYRADTTLAPSLSDKNSGNLSSGIGGLASLAGLSMQSNNSDSIAMGIEVMQSRKFFFDFLSRNDVILTLMATESWDQNTNQFEYDEELAEKINSKSFEELMDSDRLLIERAHMKFLRNLNIVRDQDTGFVELSFVHESRNFSRKILELLVTDINFISRDENIAQAKKSIEFLKQQISANKIAELQLVFFELIQGQTEKIMLAEASPEYLFRVIDPPYALAKNVRPNRVLLIIIGCLVGFVIGVSLVLLRATMKNRL